MPRRMSLRAPPAEFRGDEPAYLICPFQASSWEPGTRAPVWLLMRAGMARMTQDTVPILRQRHASDVTCAMTGKGLLSFRRLSACLLNPHKLRMLL